MTEGGSVRRPGFCPRGWPASSREGEGEVGGVGGGRERLPEEVPGEQRDDEQQQGHNQHGGEDVVIGGHNVF